MAVAARVVVAMVHPRGWLACSSAIGGLAARSVGAQALPASAAWRGYRLASSAWHACDARPVARSLAHLSSARPVAHLLASAVWPARSGVQDLRALCNQPVRIASRHRIACRA